MYYDDIVIYSSAPSFASSYSASAISVLLRPEKSPQKPSLEAMLSDDPSAIANCVASTETGTAAVTYMMSMCFHMYELADKYDVTRLRNEIVSGVEMWMATIARKQNFSVF